MARLIRCLCWAFLPWALAVRGADAPLDAWTPVQLSVFPPVQVSPESAAVAGLRMTLPYGRNRRLAGLDLGVVNRLAEGMSGVQVGLAVNIVGRGNVAGLQMALVNLHDFTIFPRQEAYAVQGLQLGLVNSSGGDLDGLQLGGLFNYIERDLRGLQVSGLGNQVQAGEVRGVQVGLFNNVRMEDFEGEKVVPFRLRTVAGVQVAGLYNRVDEFSVMRGLQVATVNLAGNLRGTQVGLWNKSGQTRGVQIGIVNIAKELHGLQIGLLNINRNAQVPFVPVMSIAF